MLKFYAMASSTRQFLSIGSDVTPLQVTADSLHAIPTIRENNFGDDEGIPTPFGVRRMTYLDYTASGKPLKLIENYISSQVYPVYGNTHTSNSLTGFQSHLFYQESQDIIRDMTHSSHEHLILFIGRGATSAVNALIHFLFPVTSAVGSKMFPCSFPNCNRAFASNVDLHLHSRSHPDGFQSAYKVPLSSASTGPSSSSSLSTDTLSTYSPPKIFLGPFAHHSSMLPFLSIPGAEVYSMPDDGSDLLLELVKWLSSSTSSESASIVVSLTSASNVTGASLAPRLELACALVHLFGGLVLLDCATSAPHSLPSMASKQTLPWREVETAVLHLHPGAKDLLAQASSALARVRGTSNGQANSDPAAATVPDAVYFSSHKFLGGPGGPGVLILRRALLKNPVPLLPGGGTVFFVHQDATPRYLGNDEERESGGSPDVLGAVRAGLALHVASLVGWPRVQERETALGIVARELLSQHPNIRVLGKKVDEAEYLPVVSFVILSRNSSSGSSSGTANESSVLLHHNFVASVLNDFFGIQARSGCLCAGPFAQRLLGIARDDADRLEECLLHQDELLRPGVVRISFPYHLSHATFRFVLDAVVFVATHGTELLPLYAPVRETGEWMVHRSLARQALSAGAELLPSSSNALHVVARASRGDGAGHVAAAQRGDVKVAPRRWLRDLGLAEFPRRELKVRPDSEASLLGAYLEEAEAVRLGVAAAMRTANSYGSAELMEASVLHFHASPGLRWFALASDVRAATSAPISRRLVTSIEAWAPSGLSASDLLDEWKSRGPKPWKTPSWLLASVLLNPSPSKSELEIWDGPTTSSPADAEKNTDLEVSNGLPSSIDQHQPPSKKRKVKIAVTPLPIVPPPSIPREINAAASSTDLKGPRQSQATREALALLPPAERATSKQVSRAFHRAVTAFPNMICNGDKIVVGLSGGKDSLSLLILLLEMQQRAPVRFEVAACTVDPQSNGYDPSSLKEFCKKLSIPYFYESQPLIELAQTCMENDSICAFCSRMKRGMLYSALRREGYNVLALGQHADDFAESFLMSAFRNGALRTMKASYINGSKDIKIIRPLVFCRERYTREYAVQRKLPIVTENCPACFEGPKERYRIKKLLASEEALNPNLFASLESAQITLMSKSETDHNVGDEEDEKDI
jgi:tRNA(Ile)-lysidine synthase TilS/MesJ/selenocysteine lyase/cysteine desulfurase